MNVVLTGTRGFVGTRVLAELEWAGHHVLPLPSDLLRGEITPDRFDLLLRHLDAFGPDAIIHTAGIADMSLAEKDPDASHLANALLPEVMATLASRFGCKCLSCSSDQVYNGQPHIRLHRETEPCQPANVYGKHKLEGEMRARNTNPDTVSLRLTWMYDLPVYRRHTNLGFPLILWKAAAENRVKECSVNDFRGITYVRTVAKNMIKALSLPGGVYNFGSENPLNLYETARAFLCAMGLEERADAIVRPVETEGRSLAMSTDLLQSYGIRFESTAEGPVQMMQDYGK